MIFKDKERGVTLGDLIIILIVILFSFFTVNKIKDSKTQQQITNFNQLQILKNIS